MGFNLVILFSIITFFLMLIAVIYSMVPKKDLKLFRILFPSWRFFEGTTPIPKIFYRTSPNAVSYGEWQALPRYIPHRTIKKLFHNPEENLNLTYQSQIEQLLNDISELSSIKSTNIEILTSYKIVSSYIKEQILLRHKNGYFQFKIGAIEFTPDHQSRWTESLYSGDCELK